MASTASTHLNFIPHNYQTQSPLFGVLPGEIRNQIFALALVQYEDDEAAYPKDSYWYRPGFAGPRKSSSALLRTCKLAYHEGKQVFYSEIEWAFWFGRSFLCLRAVRLGAGPAGHDLNSIDCLDFTSSSC